MTQGKSPPQLITTGVDLVEIEHFRRAIAVGGEAYLRRYFTSTELHDCGNEISSLAGLWAAKEATSKALGTGMQGIDFREMEVFHDELGKPYILLTGCAAERAHEIGLAEWTLSISHTAAYVVAFAIGFSIQQFIKALAEKR